MNHMYVLCPLRPEEGDGVSGTRVTGTCELPVVGAGNQTQVLCKWQALLTPESFLVPICTLVTVTVAVILLLKSYEQQSKHYLKIFE